MMGTIRDRPARLEPPARKGKRPAKPGFSRAKLDCYTLVTYSHRNVIKVSYLGGSQMSKRAAILGELMAPPVNPANGRLSSRELEKDGPGGNPLLERSCWTSEIDRERSDAGLRPAGSRRLSLFASSPAPD